MSNEWADAVASTYFTPCIPPLSQRLQSGFRCAAFSGSLQPQQAPRQLHRPCLAALVDGLHGCARAEDGWCTRCAPSIIPLAPVGALRSRSDITRYYDAVPWALFARFGSPRNPSLCHPDRRCLRHRRQWRCAARCAASCGLRARPCARRFARVCAGCAWDVSSPRSDPRHALVGRIGARASSDARSRAGPPWPRHRQGCRPATPRKRSRAAA